MTERFRIIALLVLAGLLMVLTVLVWNGDTESFDQALRAAALSLNNPVSVAIWKDISVFGSVAVITTLTPMVLIIFVNRKKWYAARALAIAMLGAMVFDNGMKWLIHRPRATEVYAGTMPTTFSYPSGHALFSFMFYLTLAALIGSRSPKIWKAWTWAAAILLVGLIGTSRIFLGVHYGSDVLAGYLISAIWMMILGQTQSRNQE